MDLLDGEVLPGETGEVDGDLKKGTMTFGRATSGAKMRHDKRKGAYTHLIN
jgi:hypothetical protein